jgi:glycosyltransferase involved in cell wall biosynthesis
MHTPMRYVWDMFDQYFGRDRVGLATYSIMRLIANRLRRWDVDTAGSVDKFIANSQHVRDRIRRHYERDSHVIHPPVDTGKFTVRERAGAYFLVFSALVPYKRIDLAISAFNKNRLPLVVAGDGPDAAKLRSMAASNVTFLGQVPDESLDELYGNAIALVFPGEEDFGIIPVEAMAAGKPVIAFGRGGALETVVDGKTGVFFQEQTVDELINAIGRFHALKFDPFAIQSHAQRFDRAVYKKLMSEFILQEWGSRSEGSAS